MEVGLKYVNNDSCYPAIVVIGQLLDEFISGRADPTAPPWASRRPAACAAPVTTRPCCARVCRDAGYPQVPVIALSVQGIEDNPGFHLGIPHIHKAIQAFVIGDAIQSMLLRVRPYEAEPGSAMDLYRTWDGYVQEWITSGRVGALGGRTSYGKLIRECVRAFDALPLRDIPRKPRVGLVGEILVKFHPDANNHAVDVIEAEGCEAELPGLMQFFHNSVATAAWDKENLGIDGKQRYIMPIVLWALKKYEKPVHRAFAATNGKFEPHRPIEEMIERSQDIARLGNQAGEGWYLTAEMVDHDRTRLPEHHRAQPFACLPNHAVGKGMFRAAAHSLPRGQHRGRRLRPGRLRGQPAQPHQAHARHRPTGPGGARRRRVAARGRRRAGIVRRFRLRHARYADHPDEACSLPLNVLFLRWTGPGFPPGPRRLRRPSPVPGHGLVAHRQTWGATRASHPPTHLSDCWHDYIDKSPCAISKPAGAHPVL